jgi:DNA-binding XRE family transcriptional regulator
MIRKKVEKEKAIRLRKEGYSYNMIAEKVNVSKSTLHNWLAEIPYTPNNEVTERIGSALAKATQAKHQSKLASFKQARQLARRDIGSFSKRDRFFFGLAIYAGEGEKNDTVGVINSNPDIVTFVIDWLHDFYDVSIDHLTLAIHCYPDNNTAACLRYWSEITGIPLSQFGKTQIDRRLNKKLGKRGKLPYGTAHLRVKSKGKKEFGVLLSRRIQAAINQILK